MKKYDAVIFDLDGTLWDSVDTVVTVWNNALEEAGLEPTLDYDIFSKCMGLRIEEIFDKVIPQATAEQREHVKKCGEQGENGLLAKKGGILYDGVEETLAELCKTRRLFIVSNCAEGYIRAFFAAHGLDKYFEDFECAGRTGKPKSDNIRLMIERSGAERPVYVGDTIMDYDAAVAANVPFIHAAYGFGEVECDEKIFSFGELEKKV